MPAHREISSKLAAKPAVDEMGVEETVGAAGNAPHVLNEAIEIRLHE